MDGLHAFFKPEILNRMDDIVLFKPLSINDMSMIVDKILTQLNMQQWINVFLLKFLMTRKMVRRRSVRTTIWCKTIETFCSTTN